MDKPIMSNVETVLLELDQNQRTQHCLEVYQKLPVREKSFMLQMMDAYIRGYHAASAAAI